MVKKGTNSKFDSMSIYELESSVETSSRLAKEHQLDMYSTLEYLRMTCRYKENAAYSKASFWRYLEDRFLIKEKAYRDNVRVYTKFPEHALTYGPGVISRIDRICGSTKVEKVVSEIKRAITSRKKEPSCDVIDNIIASNRSTRKIEKTITDWKAMYEHENVAHLATKQLLKEANETIKVLNAQVVRLKAKVGIAGAGEFKPEARV